MERYRNLGCAETLLEPRDRGHAIPPCTGHCQDEARVEHSGITVSIFIKGRSPTSFPVAMARPERDGLSSPDSPLTLVSGSMDASAPWI